MPGRNAILALAMLFATAYVAAAGSDTSLIEVRSPHFRVVSNCKPETARRVAQEMEDIRAVFQATFTAMPVDPATPLIVIALRTEGDLKSLSPREWSRRGEVRRSGFFLTTPLANYVVVWIDPQDPNAYQAFYHEYTHLLISSTSKRVPVWLEEGLAEFYSGTSIRQNEVQLGLPDMNAFRLMRGRALIPLPVLFAVDQHSPYYNNKTLAALFYAESWAITHYLMLRDLKESTHTLTEYFNLVNNGADPVQTGRQVFGDLNGVLAQIGSGLNGLSVAFKPRHGIVHSNPASFAVSDLAADEWQAIQAGIMIYDGRQAQGERLLHQALRTNPGLPAAVEAMAYLQLSKHNNQAAKALFARAAAQAGSAYMTKYFAAALALSGPPPYADAAAIEANLKSVIRKNPSYAPAYDLLAVLYLSQEKQLPQARRLELRAIFLDPANVGYRLNEARACLLQRDVENAQRAAGQARAIAHSPADQKKVADFMEYLDHFKANLPAAQP
jgi:tetratricopeptide (TPR) repeat protein